VWFFRTAIPSVIPVRSLTRCAEPIALGFIPQYFLLGYRNKTIISWFTLVCLVPLELGGEEEPFPAVGETPESVLLQRSDGRLMRQGPQATANRPSRESCCWYEVEEMSYQEISATLAIAMGTMLSRLSVLEKRRRWPAITVSKRMKQTVNYGL